jgi:hypothetical protein
VTSGRKPGRGRRRLAAAFVLFVLLALLLLPMASKRLIESRLSAFFRRAVSVADVSFRVLPFAMVLTDFRVAGMAADAPPFLEVRRIEAVPSFASALGPRLALSRVHVSGLTIRVNAFPQGGDDIPKMGGGGGGGEIRIRRLTVEQSELIVDHARVPLDLDLPEFQVRLSARRAGVLAGHVATGRGHLRFGDAPPLDVGTEMDLVAEGTLITVEAGHVRTEKTDLAYRGKIKIQKDPLGEFALNGPVDLQELDLHVMRSGFRIKGDAHFDGTMSVDGPRIRVKGDMAGTQGEYDGVPIPRYAGHVAKDEFGTHIRGLEASFLGGTGRFDIEVPPGKAIARLDARVEGIDAEPAWMAIFDIGAAGLGASATGDVAIRWPRGDIRHLSGTIGLDFAPLTDGRTPLAGRFDWSAQAGVQNVERADLKTRETWVRLSGFVQPDDRTDLAVDGESADLAGSDDLLMRLRRALGGAEARVAGFSGSGVFRGRWKGTLRVPIFEGRFSGQHVGYLGVVWGRAEWAGRSTPTEVESHSLVLRREGGELWLDGRAALGMYGEDDAVELRARFHSWPAPDFTKAFDWNLDVTGLLSGDAEIGGRRSAPVGSARITCPEGRYYGVPYTDLDVTSRLRGAVTEVPAGRARVGGGLVTFRGTLSDDDVYDGTAEVKEAEIGEVVRPALPGVFWGGRVSADVTLQGTLLRPRLRGRLTSPRLFFGDEGIGALVADLDGDGDGRVAVTALCRSPRVDVALSGSVGADVPYAADLRIEARGTSLDPFLRAALPAFPAAAGLVATGEALVIGPLREPRSLRVTVTLPSLEVQLPEHPTRNKETVRLTIDGGRLDLADLHLAGEGTDLVVAGGADLLGDGPLALSVRGAADLRTLSVVTRRLRGAGAARLAMSVSGTRAAPRVDGSLDLEGAGLRVRGFPHGLEGVRGSVRFSETAAHFEGVTGVLGGGSVELDGQVAYRSGRLTSVDVHAGGRELALRYPEGLRSTIDADLRLLGDAERQWLTGSIDVRQALWTKRYDVASELLAGGRAWEEQGSLAEGLHYDVKLRAPGTLRIDNNLATLQARADLGLTGTADTPIVLGHAEIDRGRVYFQGNTYVIRRGTIDFANPRKIDPLFDIEGETRIRSYRVTLKINGTLERVYPTLTSDPPLTAVQILNLLAGADETAVATLSPAQTDQARLAATGAATLAAGRIAEEVGLERGAERLFGLNRFSIDPSVIKGGVTNPTARLTVGKRITPDFSVLYSVDLRGTEERILSVEYTLSDRFSLLLTRADPGGFGFDLRLRQSH